MPRVSVVMSVHNGERFVALAIGSVLRQTYSDFEFIIVNDGSTDSTINILKEYAAKDARILILESTEKSGLTNSLIKACEKARGEFIARMDADDISEPDRFERQIDCLELDNSIVACGTQAWYINEAGDRVGEKNLPTAHEIIIKKLLWNNQFVHSSLMFRATPFKNAGGYNSAFKKSQDYDLMLRLAKSGRVVNLKDRLLSWRVSPQSMSWSGKGQEIDALRARWLAITKYNYPFWQGLICLAIRVLWLLLPQRLKVLRYAR